MPGYSVKVRRGDESGVSLIIVAISMILLLGVAAVAVDLASLRRDIRADRLSADAASTAGASQIEPFTGSQADVACQTAWEYALANLPDEDPSATAPNCSNFAVACNPVGPIRQEVGIADPYRITISHPVPDGHALMGSQAPNAVFDGVACQRLAVTIERVRDFTFAAVLGFNSGTTTVSSVARVRPDVGEGDVVPLVLLEPYGCDALTADGQGKITVTHFMDSPGLIAIDSDGSGPGCSAAAPYAMEVQANGDKRWIRALPVPGAGGARSAILSYALSGQPGAVASRAYNPADLTTPIDTSVPGLTGPPESYFQLYPQPVFRSQRVTRSPIDHRYNCKSMYPTYLGLTLDPCTGTVATYIDDHDLAYGQAPGTAPVPAMKRWTDFDPDCNVGSSETYLVNAVTTSGMDLWIDCNPRLVVNGGRVEINQVNVLFDGDLDLRSTGIFRMNNGDTGDYWAFFRNGGDVLKGAQSSIEFKRTFVYLKNGKVDLVGGAGGLIWTAPTQPTYRFEDLALWSESAIAHELGGQAGNTLTGTFFTPYANPFILKGQAGQLQTDAQFLTRRLVVTGFTEVLMKPDPTTSTLIPIRGVSLIR